MVASNGSVLLRLEPLLEKVVLFLFVHDGLALNFLDVVVEFFEVQDLQNVFDELRLDFLVGASVYSQGWRRVDF